MSHTGTVVVNRLCEPFDIAIDSGLWLNPYCGQGPRKEQTIWFKQYVMSDAYLLSQLHTLAGKRLGCTCTPGQPCHGDVLVELIEQAEQEKAA